MEQLRVIGTEDDRLVLATEAGDRFALALDDVLRAELRRARREQESDAPVKRASPREIQSHIRAGLSTQEVADLLEVRVEDVQKFERPVLAEREHVVGQALAVPVLMGSELDHDAHVSFGTAIRAKLAEAGASGERWTSWKEQSGWIVKLEFTSSGIDHDARWGFDPRRSTLSPQNADAVQLSRQGSLPEGLIPRLRALDNAGKDDSRFDSGAFGPRRVPDQDAGADAEDAALIANTPGTTQAVRQAATKRADAPEVTTSAETADLLEALRRRRGQREPLPEPEQEPAPAGGAPVALFDALEPGYDASEEAASNDDIDDRTVVIAEGSGRRKGRTSMPSWDEIVFGARTED
ncbi:septation protein SepH [Microbacterium sp. SSW1-59]|uniref:septation protein SepH n=1 Tax=Microbacterium xanthum TaxID=3079794 RepID=UPI002AD422D2|nr:septation protein SepH [Microbacterium sp. SSW1-59]MDZ8202370.1 septation protein SepH [Microbacterium sp. SSW1-59]